MGDNPNSGDDDSSLLSSAPRAGFLGLGDDLERVFEDGGESLGRGISNFSQGFLLFVEDLDFVRELVRVGDENIEDQIFWFVRRLGDSAPVSLKYSISVCHPDKIARPTVKSAPSSAPWPLSSESGLIHPRAPSPKATMLPYFVKNQRILKPLLAVWYAEVTVQYMDIAMNNVEMIDGARVGSSEGLLNAVWRMRRSCARNVDTEFLNEAGIQG